MKGPRSTARVPGNNNAARVTCCPSPWLKLASSPDDLISSFDMLLLHGTMSVEMRTLIREAVTAVPFTQPAVRIQQVVYLIATSDEYQVQR